VAPALGWGLAVVLLTTSRPEGDFLFAAGAGSYLFLLGGIAVAVICATLAPVRQPDGGSARLRK
jgi:ferredoxin-NADP reductase